MRAETKYVRNLAPNNGRDASCNNLRVTLRSLRRRVLGATCENEADFVVESDSKLGNDNTTYSDQFASIGPFQLGGMDRGEK